MIRNKGHAKSLMILSQLNHMINPYGCLQTNFLIKNLNINAPEVWLMHPTLDTITAWLWPCLRSTLLLVRRLREELVNYDRCTGRLFVVISFKLEGQKPFVTGYIILQNGKFNEEKEWLVLKYRDLNHQPSNGTAESGFTRFSLIVPRIYSGSSASSCACKHQGTYGMWL